MSWVSSILAGLLTGLLGGAYAGLVADRAAPWLRIPAFEGAAAYFTVLAAVLGFLGGTLIGIAACRILGGEGPGGMARGFGAGLLAVGAIVTAAGGLAWMSREQEPRAGQRPIDLAVELRLPAGAPRPVPHRDGATYVYLRSGSASSGGLLRIAEARQEEGRWIVPASLPMPGVAANRVLSVAIPGWPAQALRTDIAPNPAAPDPAWSAWREATAGAAEAGVPAMPVEMRYRVVLREEDASGAEARRRAAYAALPPDAGAEALLPFLSAAWQDRLREEAIRRFLARPDGMAVLLEAIATADHAGARDAMFIIGALNPPQPRAAGPVRARAAELLAIIGAIDPDGEDSRQRLHAGALELASGVAAAAQGLRGAGIDLRPELRAIAAAAALRERAPPRPVADLADQAAAFIDRMGVPPPPPP